MRRLAGLLRRRPRELGRRGEVFAARWLRRRGYRILHRNLMIADDEADLVAVDPDGRTLVVVEVKTRRTDQPPPEQSVNESKQFRLVRLASRLLTRKRYRGLGVRLDVIAVVWPEGGEPLLRHHAGAIESPF